jgi:aminomethyltransferase
MVLNRGHDLLVVVNGACKHADLAHIESEIGSLCRVQHLPEQALLALQGPLAATALSRLCDAPSQLVFMQGGTFQLEGHECTITRSGYTGEDGFEISIPAQGAQALARRLLAQPEVAPIGLGARNSLRLEAGLCLYGNDLNTTTNPVNANLRWAIPKVRRSGGARAGGYPGATAIEVAWAQLNAPIHHEAGTREPFLQRVGLLGQERIPVREPATLHDAQGQCLGTVCSGLLSPVLNMPIAMAYLPLPICSAGNTVWAKVRDKMVPMQIVSMPFVPHAYVRQVPSASAPRAS